MADLQDLIDVPLDEVSDEELEDLIMKGRLAREYKSEPKERKKKEPAVTKTYDEFE